MSDGIHAQDRHAKPRRSVHIHPTTGLGFRMAETADDVVTAWSLVYKAYRRGDLIPPNPHQLYGDQAEPDAHTAVALGRIGPVTISTMTAAVDNEAGLPLDRVFEAELDGLRRRDERLMEVGMFADRREHMMRSADALFELTRYAYHFGRVSGVTRVVMGVDPEHAKFYIKAFGLEELGRSPGGGTGPGWPLVLLAGKLVASADAAPANPVISYFVDNPVADAIFETRFRFEPRELAGSKLQAYLNGLPRRGRLSRTA